MKKGFTTLIIFSFIFVFFGCATVTDILYGPDLTPDQLKDVIYKDSYALGAIKVSKVNDLNLVNQYIREAEKFKSVSNPEDYLTQKFLQSLKDGEEQDAYVYFAARRLYQRVGAKLINNNIDIDDLNLDLFNYAVDAYIDGLKGVIRN